jgi:hypothetical protein
MNFKLKIYKTILLPVVFYRCETWSLTLREEHRLRVFENRVLRGIFGPKIDEVKGEWWKLHSGELHNLFSSPDIIRQIRSRRMRWAGHGNLKHKYLTESNKPSIVSHGIWFCEMFKEMSENFYAYLVRSCLINIVLG